MSQRNYQDPLYIAWRKAVFRRDGRACRMPGCGSKKGLNAHHIKRWADYPSLRLLVSNGITLCKQHHKEVYSREEEYEALFLSLVNTDVEDIRLKMIMSRYGE